MKNIIVCKNCQEENPFYAKTCRKCHSYLRDKIYNIDLWQTLGRLTENPREGFKSIILSEHKNFIIALILFSAIKFYLDSIFLSMIGKDSDPINQKIVPAFLIVLGLTLSILVVFSFLLKLITSSTRSKTRFIDNLSMFSYSLIPHAIGLCILFPIEVVLFGGYLFSVNPSPFTIKETLAYIMGGFEVLLVLWGFFLAVNGVFVQTRSLAFSLIVASIFNIVIFYSLYLTGIIL